MPSGPFIGLGLPRGGGGQGFPKGGGGGNCNTASNQPLPLRAGFM